jgi:hypothetical protein
VMTDVPVSSTAYTYVNSSLLPIAPPTATDLPRAVTGNVTPATATVRALQALTGGPTVEVAWSPVDATSGDFGFDLVRDAPVRTTFVPDPVALDFLPDAGAQGLYLVEAASDGATQLQAIDTNSPSLPPLVFVFP